MVGAISREFQRSPRRFFNARNLPTRSARMLTSLLYPSDTCLYRNKTMLDKSDAELYSLITNAHKPPKIFDFPETEQLEKVVLLIQEIL